MNNLSRNWTHSAFTLIELLIVVAIIAILASIAVPNFMEAQVRAKVSRVKSDMRSLATAIEAYRVDYNNYPLMRDSWANNLRWYDTSKSPNKWKIDTNRLANWFSIYNITKKSYYTYCDTLTTPVGYISKIPLDPFLTGDFANPFWTSERCANFSYFFANIDLAAKTFLAYPDDYKNTTNTSDQFNAIWPVSPAPIRLIRDLKVSGASYKLNLAGDGPIYYANWMMWSSGPSRDLYCGTTDNFGGEYFFDSWTSYRNHVTTDTSTFDTQTAWNAKYSPPYDPTNGSKSRGRIYRLNGGGNF